MPIDFQQIYSEIHIIGENAQANQEILARQRERAWKVLEENTTNLDPLHEKVERTAREADPNLRCALPCSQELMTHLAVVPVPEAVTLIAVDGSQIIPDRHQSLTYGVVNVGAVTLRTGSSEAPQIFTESELLYDETLRSADGFLLDEGGIALKRDARERALLLELAGAAPAPVIALTDGPVELWGAKDPANAGSYAKFLRAYLQDLDKFNALEVILGGYVDKPAADLVVRLLELAIADETALKDLRKYHPFMRVTDRWIFGRLLKPGERSAVFALQSSSRARYTEARAIHFFYLNVSTTQRPSITRVECPQWVADDSHKIDLLHALLVRQSSLLGAKPYPYILHRAHETAKVSFDEKEQVEMLLSLELRKHGVEMEAPSEKQTAKNQSGTRGSYKR